MLDTFIIEEIRRREEARRREQERPRLPIPERDLPRPPDSEAEEGDPERGVVIIDYSA
jgi:hypothetical protein